MTIRVNNAVAHQILDNLFNGAAGVNFNSGTLEFRSGAQPATADTALTGTVLATIALPADAFGAAGAALARRIDKAGTWQDAAADAGGTIGYFTLRDSGGTLRIDGSVTATGGGGDAEVNNTVLALAQQFTVTSFTLTVQNL